MGTDSKLPYNAIPRSEPQTFRARELMASLTVDDLETSLAFYRDIVGFIVGEKHEEDGEIRAAEVKAGNVSIFLNQDDGAKGWDREKGQGFSLHLTTVQSVENLAKRIEERGGTLESQPTEMPWGGKAFRVKDPDGFLLNFSSAG